MQNQRPKLYFRGTPRPEVFPFGEDGNEADEFSERRGSWSQTAQTITSTYWKGAKGSHVQQLNNPTHSNDRVYGADGISPTLNTMQGGMRQPFVVDPQGRKNKVCTPTSSSPTLRANTHGNQPVVNGIRRLTPTECERLQGFPDGWTKYGGHKKAADVISKNPEHGDAFNVISDTQRYKCLGNAVTVNVIRDIFMRMI